MRGRGREGEEGGRGEGGREEGGKGGRREEVTKRLYNKMIYSLSITAAAPIPEPIHIETTPKRPFWRRSSGMIFEFESKNKRGGEEGRRGGEEEGRGIEKMKDIGD